MGASAVGIEDVVEQDRKKRMSRIRRLSQWMAKGCLVTSGALAGSMLYYWVATPTRTLFSQAGIANASVFEIDVVTRVLAFGISMLPLATLIYGLWSACRCFAAFGAGRIFAIEPIRRLKLFAVAVAISALLKPFAGAALSVLLSVSHFGAAKTLVLTVGSDTIIALIFAGIVAIIAWVMHEALDIAEENRQFV